jgi:hypothetical protein
MTKAGRAEDPLAHETPKRLATRSLRNEAKKRIIGIAIGPLAARLEQEAWSQAAYPCQHLLRGFCDRLRWSAGGVIGVVWNPGSVDQQLVNGSGGELLVIEASLNTVSRLTGTRCSTFA